MSAASPVAGPRRPRNHVIDAARAFSVLVVVVFHALLYRFRWGPAGLEVVPWAPDHAVWWPLSWIFLIIPVFFVAGGFGHAILADRMHAEGLSYATFVANRGRRLIGPLLLFVATTSVLASAAAWAGLLAPAVTLSRQLMQLLWFLAVYLVIIAVAPLAVRAHDRRGWRPMLLLAVLATGVDAWSFAVDRYELRNLNMLLVWPLVHQFGIAYHRGWFRTGPRWRALLPLGAGVGGILLLVGRCGYPASAVGFADIPIANVQPPTLAMAALALAQCGVLGLVERSHALERVPRRLEIAIGAVNALMMSVYLWHILGIGAAALGLLELAKLWPAAGGVLLAGPTVAVASVVVVAALVPLIAQLEVRLIAPLGTRQDGRLAIAAFSCLTLGTIGVWLTGTVVHPDAPWSSLSVALVGAGAWLMRRAAAS